MNVFVISTSLTMYMKQVMSAGLNGCLFRTLPLVHQANLIHSILIPAELGHLDSSWLVFSEPSKQIVAKQ